VKRRFIPISLAVGAAAMAMAPTMAFAGSSGPFNFTGNFWNQPSVAQGEYALASQAAAQVCPSYGNWTDNFQSFDYIHYSFLGWNWYDATNVHFSVSCNWQSASYTFSGAYFYDYDSVQDGENAIENYYWQNTCGGGNHRITNFHFNPFEYIVVNHQFLGITYSTTYTATGISGSFTCDT
jgi:hypothetical protein